MISLECPAYAEYRLVRRDYCFLRQVPVFFVQSFYSLKEPCSTKPPDGFIQFLPEIRQIDGICCVGVVPHLKRLWAGSRETRPIGDPENKSMRSKGVS